jgi:phage terminase large subunit-like protein
MIAPKSGGADGKPARPTLNDFLALPEREQARILALLGREGHLTLLHDWRFWARPDQLPPAGDWIVWLILAGRGAGKTRAGAEMVREWVKANEFVNLIGPTGDDARDVMALGESGVLACCRKSERPHYERSKARLRWPNGATSLLFSADEPDRLRGKQHMKLWCDEVAAWRRPEAFDLAKLGLRLGDRPQAVVTTTPRPTRFVKELIADGDTVVTRATTRDNHLHLADAFLTRITAAYAGLRLGRQEIEAEIVEDAPGALWTREMIERTRVTGDAAPAAYSEIIVAVDPPARSGPRADECGLIVAARAENGEIFILADLTSQGETPAGWSARVVAAYKRYRANRVVAEINNGGEMVADVMRQCDPNLPVRAVTATRGKFARAEPVATAYERGMVHHVGIFPKLEDQLCVMTPDFDSRANGFSPDRADALVWAVTDFIDGDAARGAGLLAYYRDAARRR